MTKLIKNAFILILCLSFVIPQGLVFAREKSEDDFIYQGLDTLPIEIDISKLDNFKNVHPRILIDEKRFEKALNDTKNDERMGKVYIRVKEMADASLSAVPNRVSGDGNNFAKNMSAMTYIYKVTKDEKYLNTLCEYIKSVCSIEKWEKFPDLATGKILTALGMCYDWLYNDLPSDLKATMKTKMLYECENAYIYISNPENPVRTWLQNHTWIINQGMGIAAFALYEEDKSCYKYIKRATRHFITTASLLPKDGFNHEGVDYLFYGMESLFIYNSVLKDLLDINLFDVDFYKNVTDFIIYTFFPEKNFKSENSYFEYNDATGDNNVNPYLLSIIAREKKDPYAKWFADMAIDNSVFGSNPFLYLLWNDKDLEAKKPYDKDTMKYFPDADFVFSRSSWNNNESIISFMSGPPMGHFENERTKDMDIITNWGAGHVHPHSNNILLYGNGESLLRDDNYAWPKLTKNHNTLTIDDIGQLGEGSDWFNHKNFHREKGDSKIEKALSTPEYDYMVGDATKAYPKNLGVKNFKRHILFLKPNALIVVDDVELLKEREMELRFFPDSDVVIKQNDGSFLSVFKNTKLKITPLNKDIETKVINDELNTRYYKEERKAVEFIKKGKTLRNITAITWDDVSKDIKDIAFKEKGDELIFSVDNLNVSLNPSLMKAERTNDFAMGKRYLKSNDSKAKMIVVNGEGIDFFSPDTFTYDVESKEENPNVTAIPNDTLANVTVTKNNKEYIVKITSSDKTSSSVYKINLKSGNERGVGPLPIVNIVADSPDENEEFPLSNILDSDLKNRYTLLGNDRFIKADFGEEKNLNKVAIAFTNGGTRLNYFEVLASLDDKNYKKVYDGYNYKDTPDVLLYEFTPVKARYVKLVFKGNSTNLWNNITNIGFYDDKPYVKDLVMNFGSDDLLKDKEYKPTYDITLLDGTKLDPKDAKIDLSIDDTDIAEVRNNTIYTKGYGTLKVTARVIYNDYAKFFTTILRISDGSLSLPVLYDGFLIPWGMERNYGGTQLIEIKDMADAPLNSKIAYLTFDKKDMVKNAKKVTLCIYGQSDPVETGVSDVTLSAFETKGKSRKENELTYSNSPEVRRYLSSAVIGERAGSAEFDVTKAYNNAKDDLFTIAVKAETLNGFVKIRAKESSEKYMAYLKIYEK